MARAFGGRFDDENYAVTTIDADTGTVTTVGEIAGEPFEVEAEIEA